MFVTYYIKSCTTVQTTLECFTRYIKQVCDCIDKYHINRTIIFKNPDITLCGDFPAGLSMFDYDKKYNISRAYVPCVVVCGQHDFT